MVVDNRINSSETTLADSTEAGTTTFTETSNVVMNAKVKPQESSQLYPIRDQAISDFLAKPYLVTSGTWTTSNVVNTNLASGSVWSNLVANPLWTDKLSGFNFIRATAVYRIVLNGNPFHAGLVKFGFIPFLGSVITTPNIQPTWRSKYLSTFSTVPGAMLEVKDSTGIVKIPYVSTVDYATLETGDHIDWGTWFLKVYSPLSTGATNTPAVDYTVYLHFEDVELAVPLHPQSNSSKKSYTPKKKNDGFKKFTAHVGRQLQVEAAMEEASIMAGTGVISKGLMVAGNAVHALENVPILSSIAGPTGWILRCAGTVASWFGYSKPELDSPPANVQRLANPHMANATGVDTSVSLALYHDNAIVSKPGFGAEDLDEMNFDYIKTIPSYFDSRGWGATNIPGEILWSFDVGPQAIYQTISNASPAISGRSYTPFGYLSTFFRTYRGSIDIHIRIIKTDYHSGRLSFEYIPGSTASIPTAAQGAYLLREIVDIREKSEVVLRLPYLEYQKFIGVEDIIGRLQVRVINALKNPNTVSNVIDFVLSASAGSDFEYAIPGQALQASFSSIGVPFIPQMGSTAPDVNQTLVMEPIGNYPTMPETNEAVSFAIGEKFVSVRQLLLRYTRLASTITVPTYGGNKAFTFWPFTTAIPVNLSASTFSPKLSMDALCRLAHGYAFMRGSIRVLIPTVGVNSSLVMRNITALNLGSSDFFENVSDPTDYDGSIYNTVKASSAHCDAVQIFDRGVGVASARLPYYCENHSTAILPVENNLIPQDVWDPYSILNVVDEFAGATSKIMIRRSIGEDFQMGYFLGFPPIMRTP